MFTKSKRNTDTMNILKSFRPSDKTQKFFTFEGDCYRNDNLQLVRKSVAWHYRTIDSINKLKACLRAGEYTSLGMYRLFFITEDGSCLSFSAVLDNLQEIYYSMRNNMKDGWSIVALGCVNDSDEEIYCDHTSELLS